LQIFQREKDGQTLFLAFTPTIRENCELSLRNA